MKTDKMKARFWTKKECGTTLGQCKRAGFRVQLGDGMTKVYDENTLVVSWINGGPGQRNMVRYNVNYFESQI